MRSAEHTHLHCLPPQYNEALRPLHHESRELVAQYPLDFVRLLDLDANSYGVDRGLNENAFVLVSGDGERVEEHLLRRTALI